MNGEEYKRWFEWCYNPQYFERIGCGVPIIVGSIIILFFMCSCKSIKYVPVETVKTEYITKTDSFVQKDSVYLHDSVYVIKNGDTTTICKTRILYRDRWRDKILRDSIIKIDSIQIPYPIEKPLTKWEKIKMDAGGIALGGCFVVILMILLGLFLGKRIR